MDMKKTFGRIFGEISAVHDRRTKAAQSRRCEWSYEPWRSSSAGALMSTFFLALSAPGLFLFWPSVQGCRMLRASKLVKGRVFSPPSNCSPSPRLALEGLKRRVQYLPAGFMRGVLVFFIWKADPSMQACFSFWNLKDAYENMFAL